MATVVFAVNPARSSSSARKKPALLFRGRRRKALVHLRQKMSVILNQDAKERDRSDRLGYDPALFASSPGSPEKRAALLIIDRCDELLSARDGE